MALISGIIINPTNLMQKCEKEFPWKIQITIASECLNLNITLRPFRNTESIAKTPFYFVKGAQFLRHLERYV